MIYIILLFFSTLFFTPNKLNTVLWSIITARLITSNWLTMTLPISSFYCLFILVFLHPALNNIYDLFMIVVLILSIVLSSNAFDAFLDVYFDKFYDSFIADCLLVLWRLKFDVWTLDSLVKNVILL